MKKLILLLVMLNSLTLFAQTIPKLGIQTPVEFTGLSLSFKDNLTLNWSTASEKNNSHFVIKRSTDSKEWLEVGSVQGYGTTSVKQDYSWSEYEELTGGVYYKLIQVDLNNKETELTISYYNFTSSYFYGLKLNGLILSVRKIEENGSSSLVLVVTDKQSYKIIVK